MKFSNVLLVIVLFGASALSGQTTLKIVDQKTMSPLFSALVQDADGKGLGVSDLFGFVELDRSKEGDKVLVSYLGYETQQVILNGSQQQVELQALMQGIDEVLVSATRVGKKGVFATENFSAAKLAENNLGQDLPLLLNQATSVVTSSDAGNGVGYTGIRVRGSDPTRINVTINGIPVNDAESQGVFWVDLPDLASSTNSVQIQRGVGTSTNGAGAFGATINLQTDVLRDHAYVEASAAAGSFNTQKYTFKAGTGLINDIFTTDVRLSKISSDGYIDRAFSDLSSLYVSSAAYLKKDVIKFIALSGKEKTYQAWNGVYEGDLEQRRTYNYTGEYTDLEGNTAYYDDETDNYWQHNNQLHWGHRTSDVLDFNMALHYTRGYGYYEQYRQDDDLDRYGLDPVTIGGESINSSDLIRRRWLDNHFGGLVFSANYLAGENTKLTFGGGANQYIGDHYGQVIWSRFASNGSKDHEYYRDDAVKTDINLYAKLQQGITDQLSGFLDLQYRGVDYTFEGFNSQLNNVDQQVNYHFFNPKAGLFYQINSRSDAFVSISFANKEPNRNDFTENSANTRPLPEKLRDIEAGWSWNSALAAFKITAYHMSYKDQLILTGKINDVGEYARTNVDNSYRMGVELEAGFQIMPGLTASGNLTLSQNKIQAFSEFIDAYDADFNYLGQQETLHENTDISFSPPVIGGLVATYKPSRFFGLEWQTKYVGAQYLDNTMNASRRLSPFHTANIRLFGDAGLGKINNVSWNILVNNVFNAMYSNNGYTYGYAVDGVREDFNYVYPQAGINFLAGISLGF
ncbi:MAG: TonB-dependent receptor [Saprospiraceae bacterium]|nr:TonB-dependent receptor [Saprospiraceae bacterium]